MKNLSIIIQIIIINAIVMALFIVVFITKNYQIVTNQLNTLEDEKISSIVQTIRPIVSINLSLGIESNYEEIIKNTITLHQEINAIELIDNEHKLIFKHSRKDFDLKNSKIVSVPLEDSLLKIQIGTMNVYYTFSTKHQNLLNDFLQFLFWMLVLFICSLIFSLVLIKYNLSPLKILIQKITEYKLSSKNDFEQIRFKNEIAVINNTIKEMIERIEKEVDTRILYEKEVMQKNRLASMGEMLDNIAHQWRQPLMRVNATLLNIERNIELDKLDKSYIVQKINEASQNIYLMSQTIEVFREYVNPNKTKQKFEIENSIQKAITFMQTLLHKTDIFIDCEKSLEIYGVENEFIQATISILTNMIEIFEQRKILEKQIKIQIYQEDEFVITTIEDNAHGIEEDIMEKIFDPYFTTKYKAGGTGIGLYICKKIIEQSFNGTLNAINTDHGAKFIIKIKGTIQ